MLHAVFLFYILFLTLGYASDPTPPEAAPERKVFLRSYFPEFPMDFPKNSDETQTFPDSAPIPFPRAYAPLVEILKKVQEPGLTFAEAQPFIEEYAGLISTLYRPNYGKPDPRLCACFAGVLGAKSWGGVSASVHSLDAILAEEADKHPERMVFPPTWQFVMCYLKALENEENRLKHMPKSDEEIEERKKPLDKQRKEFTPLHSSKIDISILSSGINAVFDTVLGREKNAPSSFFGSDEIDRIFYVLGVSETNPCPKELTLATHKLFFMIYFNHLLVNFYDLYHCYMEGWDWNDDGVQLLLTSVDDYPKPFRDVCSRVWNGPKGPAQSRGAFCRTGWNTFYHINAMIPHIVYVDDDILFDGPIFAVGK